MHWYAFFLLIPSLLQHNPTRGSGFIDLSPYGQYGTALLMKICARPVTTVVFMGVYAPDILLLCLPSKLRQRPAAQCHLFHHNMLSTQKAESYFRTELGSASG